MPAFWALLISIETYAHPDWPHVKGASHDSARISSYLQNSLSVPPHNIRTVVNEQATRSEILRAFREHLVENKQVQKGDGVVIAYSGHGSRSKAPEGWAVVEERNVTAEGEEEGKGPMLEMIIPYDESTPDANGDPICGIPDRTLGILLDLICDKVGDNVTVILDCCHSGHGTRDSRVDEKNPFQTRSIDPHKVTPLRADVDKDLYVHESELQGMRGSAGRKPLRGAFTQRRAKSHVLLAACGPHEEALGETKGGLLTTYLLKALQNPAIHPRTYAEIMKYVNRDLDVLRAKYPKFVKQHAQCEGVARDRVVFEETVPDRRQYRVTKESKTVCRIEAGEVHGIKMGTLFALHEMSKERWGLWIGNAKAAEVNELYCLANVPEEVEWRGDHHVAAVTQEAYKLAFTVVNTAPDSSEARNTLDVVEKGLENVEDRLAGVLDRRPPGSKDVDLVLEIDEGGITLVRKDIYLRDLTTHSPRIDVADVTEANFPAILDAIARFNFYLAQTSSVKPLAGDVDLEFHLLEPDLDYDEFDDKPVLKARGLQKEVVFKNDEATIVKGDTDDYAFILRNDSNVHLFPHLIYFDTGTYQIETWYTPFEAEKPTLHPGCTLQIGASPEHSKPFAFFIREGDDVDTSFMKVYLLKTEMDMGFMDQPPVVGYDEDGKSYVKAGLRDSGVKKKVETPSRKGGWDCITRKITVTRR